MPGRRKSKTVTRADCASRSHPILPMSGPNPAVFRKADRGLPKSPGSEPSSNRSRFSLCRGRGLRFSERKKAACNARAVRSHPLLPVSSPSLRFSEGKNVTCKDRPAGAYLNLFAVHSVSGPSQQFSERKKAACQSRAARSQSKTARGSLCVGAEACRFPKRRKRLTKVAQPGATPGEGL